jgi:C-terminal processing protease CtpA/Prc
METRPIFKIMATALVCVTGVLAIESKAQQQKIDSINAGRLQTMLEQAHDEVKKHYYDPTYHGLDWDDRYQKYVETMKQATSLGQGFSVIAGMLDGLNDSHTFFQPPSRPVKLEYGFRLIIVGDKAFILRARPGTDAEAKVHPGDEVLAYNKFVVNRESLWKMDYYFNRLSPRNDALLVLRDPAGNQREVKVDAKTHQLKRVMDLTQESDVWQMVREGEEAEHEIRQLYYEMGEALIWKMPIFFATDGEVDHMFSLAKKHKALVLDLRGNPGGAVVTLERMVGNVFDHDVNIADRKGRKELKPQLAKGHGKDAFSGKIVVLIDSKSASAAELFARVMQLEQRGVVVGDRSSGSVMESRRMSESQGVDSKIFYGFSVTDADLIMKDGKSLEHMGVTPDEIVLPTARDLAEGKDPALVRAAALVGLTLEPAQAGKMFPYEWPPL